MISLKTNGQAFDLGNISITFRLRSPLFNEVPSHTFSFELPGTPNNLRLTGHLHRVTNNKAILADIPITANIHGWIFAATLRVQSANKKAIKCFMAIDNAQLNVDWGDKMLQEAGFGLIPFVDNNNQILPTTNLLNTADAQCQFPPCYVPDFFDNDEPYFSGHINLFEAEESTWFENFPDNASGSAVNASVFVPMFYYKFILKELCNKNGIALHENLFSLSDFRDLIIFNNVPLESKQDRYSFKASRTAAQSFYGQTKLNFPNVSSPNFILENCYNSSLSVYLIRAIGLHEFVIKFYVTSADGQYIKLTFKYPYKDTNGNIVYGTDETYMAELGWNTITHTHVFNEDVINEAVWVELWCYNMNGSSPESADCTVSADGYFSGKNLAYSNLAKFYGAQVIYPANHLPQIKIKDFLSWLHTFGAYFFFDSSNKQITVTLFKDILSNPATKTITNLSFLPEIEPSIEIGLNMSFDIADDDAPLIANIKNFEYIGSYGSLSDIPIFDVVNKLAYVTPQCAYYRYLWDDAQQKFKWERYCDYNHPHITGNGEHEIKSEWNPPAMHHASALLGFTPKVGCKGSTKSFKVGVNKAPNLLMHFYGAVESFESGHLVPYASGTCYDNHSNKIGTLHLGFDTEDGLYAKYLKPIEDFYAQAVLLTARKQTDSQFLRQIDWAEKYLVQGREFLLDTVEFTATAQGFGTAELTAYRCP